ncbi:MAG TPA: hypothetical protein VIN60_00075 [Anaerolineales bacterium]
MEREFWISDERRQSGKPEGRLLGLMAISNQASTGVDSIFWRKTFLC